MRAILCTLLLAGLAAPAAAQPDLSTVEVRVERLAPGVAVLFGSGGNIGLSYGEDGNVLIDDQYAPLTDKIAAAVATLDPDPVRFVVNTHWHRDHTGGNENFGKRGAVIMAHENVRARMSVDTTAGTQTLPAAPKGALPVLTFADGVKIHLNGDVLTIVHVANAHTDGDALVHWDKANVLHMGDTFFNRESLPLIDRRSGGSIDGMIAAVERALTIANEATRIVPGHGPVGTRQELVAYRDMLKDVRGKVAAAIEAGRSWEETKALGLASGYQPHDGFVKPDQFVEMVYRSLLNPTEFQ